MIKFFKYVGVASLVAASASSHAALVTFFGEDPTTAGVLGPNSTIARNDFLSNLQGVGNENFESFANGQSSPLNLVFPGSSGNLNATLTGTGRISNSTGFGRFATSGRKYLEVETGRFRIDFEEPVSAFGFNGIDVGDFVTAQMTLNLEGGGSEVLTVPHSLNIGNFARSSSFFGFIDDTVSYTSIEFTNAGGGDVFAFDDMVIGDIGQVKPKDPTPKAIPELSASGAPLAVALIACLLGLRRERSRKSA